VLAVDSDGGDEINTDGILDAGGTYYYVTDIDEATDLTTAVDLEVIKERTRVPSETTENRENFRTKLLKRDVRCVFTGVSAEEGDGIHIIPYKRGTEWYMLIVANRPKDKDNLNNLRGINDIQNGVFVGTNVHRPFDAHRLVILKVRCFCLPMFSRLISASPSVSDS